MHFTYPPRLPLARTPTPLEPMDRLSREVGGPRIWIKRDDLTGAALSGNKIRKLEFIIAEALAQRCDTLITCGAVQSNHCRATALAGARVGLKVHLILRGSPEEVPDANLMLDHLAGAEISYYERAEYNARRPEIFQELTDKYAREGHRAFSIPTGGSDEIGAWGYVAAAEELKGDFLLCGISPGHIVTTTGSGGTHAGLAAGCHLHGIPVSVWGINISDNASSFQEKADVDLAKWRERYGLDVDLSQIPIQVIDGHVGPGYGKAEPPVYETIARVARLEGIVLDPVYTGKAFHGMLHELAAGRFAGASDIVFIHTGGIFGLFPHRGNFNFGSRE